MNNTYHRHIGPFSATMLIAGSMIGSGIFIVPAEMIRTGGTGVFLLLAWGLTAALTLLGAHSYGELAGMFPTAGGQFVYLKESYGRLVAFLYGWTTFLIIETGALAAVTMAFGKFLGTFLPAVSETRYLVGPLEVRALEVVPGIVVGPYHLGLTPARLAAIGVIVLLSVVNAYGGRIGVWIQNVFTVAKLGSLAALILVGLLAGAPAHPAGSGVPGTLPFLAALLVAQSGSLFSSDSWNSVTFIASEIREPRRSIPLALLVAPLMVLGLYLLANTAYLRVLGPGGIASAAGDRVGTATLHALFGPAGSRAMALAILVSTFGCANGLVLAGSRLYQTMAADRLFFTSASRLNRFGVPAWAMGFQAAWACLLTLTGSYAQLLEFSMVAATLFYVLTVAGIFVLRRKRPTLERPVKIFAYPLPPLLYLAGALAFIVALLIYRPSYTWPGMALVLLGVPVYLAAFRDKHSFQAICKRRWWNHQK
ncbi:MAG: amino acid permease [Holophaga sp.]|nr:amino acid permease [Holophaga sp.]